MADQTMIVASQVTLRYILGTCDIYVELDVFSTLHLFINPGLAKIGYPVLYNWPLLSTRLSADHVPYPQLLNQLLTLPSTLKDPFSYSKWRDFLIDILSSSRSRYVCFIR